MPLMCDYKWFINQIKYLLVNRLSLYMAHLYRYITVRQVSCIDIYWFVHILFPIERKKQLNCLNGINNNNKIIVTCYIIDIDRYVLLILLDFQQSYIIFTIEREKCTDVISRSKII